MSLSPTHAAALSDLLVSAFSEPELRRLFRYDDRLVKLYDQIPGAGTPLRVLADAAVERLDGHGLVDGAFFALLLRERPNRKDIPPLRDAVLQAATAPRPEPPIPDPAGEEAKVRAKADTKTKAKAKTRKITVLLMDANPGDLGRLRIGEEIRAIEEAKLKTPHGRRFKLQQAHEVRADDMPGLLVEHEPDIVHFSGHSTGQDGLAFIGPDGKATMVRGDNLARLFRSLVKERGRPILVVLNSCWSAEQAAVIRDEVGCVVGMNNRIADSAAIAYASTFYAMLARGRSVASAHDWGKGAIGLLKERDTAVPELLHRADVDPCTLVFVP